MKKTLQVLIATILAITLTISPALTTSAITANGINTAENSLLSSVVEESPTIVSEKRSCGIKIANIFIFQMARSQRLHTMYLFTTMIMETGRI